MFLHLGAQVSIFDKDIIAVLSIDTLDRSELTVEFLNSQKATGKVLSVDTREPKSVVITPHNIYLSPISVSTLRRRHDAGYKDLTSAMSIDSDELA